MKVLEDTPAVLYTDTLLNESMVEKSHLIKKGIRIQCNTDNLFRSGSWIVNEFFLQFSLFDIHDTSKAGHGSSYVFLKLVYLTNHDTFNCVKRQCD